MMRIAVTCFLIITICGNTAEADNVRSWTDWWLTPDQQAQRLFDQERYTEAAEQFTTPDRIGTARYLAGDFEGAAAAWGRVNTAEAAYNRGNALILLGQYDEAIASFDRALEIRPGWKEASENRAIAIARKQALEPPGSDNGGTEGKLKPDEIVFDQAGKNNTSDQEQVVDAANQKLSEEAMRALWLRRVDTKPSDFLAAKFRYQLDAENKE